MDDEHSHMFESFVPCKLFPSFHPFLHFMTVFDQTLRGSNLSKAFCHALGDILLGCMLKGQKAKRLVIQQVFVFSGIAIHSK